MNVIVELYLASTSVSTQLLATTVPAGLAISWKTINTTALVNEPCMSLFFKGNYDTTTIL